MRQILENGAEIITGHGIKVGLMQTEEEGKPEAWLHWMEGQGIMSEYGWRRCTRAEAIAQIMAWLETVGLTLSHGQIVEF